MNTRNKSTKGIQSAQKTDVLNGTSYNDIFGTNENDNGTTRPKLVGTEGCDRIYGRNGNDIMEGLGGNDLLDGGAGVDTMYGGKDDDTYIVTGSGLLTDIVVEKFNEGTDTVRAGASYTLGAHVENLELMSFIALPGQPAVNNNFNGTGNSGSNTIIGNIGNNVLSGLHGADHLKGGIGNDTLYGGEMGDVLDGGLGADWMEGGVGSDVYYVDNAGDTVVETANEAGDRVELKAAMDYTLPNNVEKLWMHRDSSTGHAGTGNALKNEIVGGKGNDTISGLDGDDNLTGYEGNDLVLGGNGKDALLGTGLTTYGKNEIDTLTGGANSDLFVLANAQKDFYNDGNLVLSGTTDYALITDFAIGQDKIQLSQNASRYRIQDVTLGSTTGAGIYIKSNNNLSSSELIGVVQNVSASSLNLNSASFTYAVEQIE